jgi:SAM-dependent methyltransferase
MGDYDRSFARGRPVDLAAARLGHAAPAPHGGAEENVAAIYNQAGEDYIAYADGNPTQLFDFPGMHAYADRYVWAVLEERLLNLRDNGATSVNLLDAGCGPGTWLRRLVTCARTLGFTDITARGFDIAQAQIHRARLLSRNLSNLPGTNFTFDVADLTGRLPEANASVDIAICLYSVLSHLPIEKLSDVAAEIARVTSGHFITSVRSIGSAPTAFVDSMASVRRLNQDHDRDRCEIELGDGRRACFAFHLFSAAELRDRFASHFHVEHVQGLDLFHSRFAPDPRWNPSWLRADCERSGELARLEQAYSTHPDFIDRATHLLLVARSRRPRQACQGAATNPL